MALNNLGYIYEHGVGVPRNLSKAAKFYCEAAKSNLPEAQQNWAVVEAGFEDLPRDCDQAAAWIANAAPQEFKSGTSNAEPRFPAGHPNADAVLCAKR